MSQCAICHRSLCNCSSSISYPNVQITSVDNSVVIANSAKNIFDLSVAGSGFTLLKQDSTSIAFTGNGKTTPLTATARVSSTSGNILSIDSGGLFVPTPVFNETANAVIDTGSIDFTTSGTLNRTITGTVRISSDANNILTLGSGGIGLYVPAPPSTTINILDSTSIDLSGNGSSGTPLSATVKVSANAGNSIQALSDGLFAPTSEVPLTFNNGVVRSSNVVKLGGTLTASQIIDTGANTLQLTGNHVTPTQAAIRVSETGGGNAIFADGSTGETIRAFATTGIGVRTISNSGTGLWADSISSYAGVFQNTPPAINTIAGVLMVRRLSSGIAANDLGGSIDFNLQSSVGSSQMSGQIANRWTVAADATRSSRFEFWLVNNTVNARKAAILHTGTLVLDTYGTNTHIGTPAYNLVVDATGNVLEAPMPISENTTASNGLTLVAPDVVLGGLLTQNTVINAGASFDLTIQGSKASGSLLVANVASGATAFRADATTGIAALANATSGIDVSGVATNGTGIKGLATTGTGIIGTSTSGLAGDFSIVPASTTGVVSILSLTRGTLGTGTNGIGGSLDFYLNSSTSVNQLSNQIVSKWTDATAGTRTSAFEVWGLNSAVNARKMLIAGNGDITFDAYPSTRDDGAVVSGVSKVVYVDSTGKLKVGTATFGGAGALSDGDKGDIVVSASGTVWTIDTAVVTFAKMQNITTDRLIGRDTAGTGSPEEISLGGGLEFTGTSAIQTSAITGDVTKAAGGTVTTIANDAVTYAKMQNMTTNRLLGRSTAGSGDVEELQLGSGLLLTGGTLSVTVAADLSSTVTYSANQTGLITDVGKLILLNGASASVDYTINPATFPNKVLTIKSIDSTNVVRIVLSSGTIDGATNAELLQWETRKVYVDGTNAYVLN